MGALAPSSETNFDKVEKADKFADVEQNVEIVENESKPEAISVYEEKLASNVIESYSQERG